MESTVGAVSDRAYFVDSRKSARSETAPTDLPKLDLYRRIVQAKLFIDSHFAERIDAGEIADEACYSKFHFIRTFKSIYGRTPHQYLTHVRVERAKEMLEQEVSVTEACFAVGFDSLGSFTGLFKRRTGLTPSEYQRRQLERRAQMKKEPLRFIPGCFAMHCMNSNFREARLSDPAL